MKVCANCFNDLELKQYITFNSKEEGICEYCKDETYTKLLDVNELLDFFTDFIGIFQNDPNGKTLINLIQQDWSIFSGEDSCKKILSDLLPLIEASKIDPKINVSYIDEITECTSYWETLKDDLKWNRRFLTDIDKIIELGWDSFFGRKNTLSEKEYFYRARLHYYGEKTPYSAEEMGCPHRKLATSGRANPQGIPYLYLSKSIETTLYETRATYLDYITIGTFKIKKDSRIVVVDFTEEESPFINSGNIREFAKIKLLKKDISKDLSKPIRRFDSELEYIPTQFICEFIRYITGADGILFDSSLHFGGKNIVLFEQKKVKCMSVKMHKVIKLKMESEEIQEIQ